MRISIRREHKGRLFLALLALCGSTLSLASEPPPAEAFGMRPHMDSVMVSPGGTHLAALQWGNGKPFLVVYDLDDKAEDPARYLGLDVGGFVVERMQGIHWFNEDTIGVAIGFESWRAGIPVQQTRLFSVKRDLSKGRWIPKTMTGRLYESQFQDRILDYLPEDPDHILMEFDLGGDGRQLDVIRVDVNTGHARAMSSGGEHVASYIVDQQGQVRLRYDVRDKKQSLMIRDSGKGRWRPLEKVDREDTFEIRPLGFTREGNRLVVFRQDELGLDSLSEYDPVTREFGAEIFAMPGFDVLGIKTDPYTRKMLGASWAMHYPKIHYFDEQLATIQQQIDKTLPDTQNSILNHDRDRRRFMVLATSPRVPGTYYLFSQDQLELELIGHRYASRLPSEQLHDVEPMVYEARDGLPIPAYLTKPDGPGPYAMIALPHGGPTARDYRGFDPLAQFLASRGYAVFQPNFRGSSGYGALFQAAGHGQWGLAMQDDVTDGVKAMIELGIADAERICIVGWSYGGYAALMGAIKTPELYRCAVSGAGVTDIRRMLAQDSRYKFGERNQPSVGHYSKDRGKLKDNSPANNVEQIEAAILLVHGDKDLTVPISHSKMMAARLKRLKKPHRMVVLKNGNHHLALEENRVLFYRELEKFLAEQIGGEDPRGPGR